MTEISTESQKAMDQLASAHEPKQESKPVETFDQWKARMSNLPSIERLKAFHALQLRDVELKDIAAEALDVRERMSHLGPLVGVSVSKQTAQSKERKPGLDVDSLKALLLKNPGGMTVKGIQAAFPNHSVWNTVQKIKQEKTPGFLIDDAKKPASFRYVEPKTAAEAAKKR